MIDRLTRELPEMFITLIRESNRLFGKNMKIIMMIRTCTKFHHLRADEDDDDELDKIHHYL